MMPELKTCPFCGGTDIQHRGTPGHYSVQCACFRGGFETPGGAEECWNHRATRPDGGDSLREAALRDAVAALGLVKLYFEKMNSEQPVKDLAPHINSFFSERYQQIAALAAKDASNENNGGETS